MIPADRCVLQFPRALFLFNRKENKDERLATAVSVSRQDQRTSLETSLMSLSALRIEKRRTRYDSRHSGLKYRDHCHTFFMSLAHRIVHKDRTSTQKLWAQFPPRLLVERKRLPHHLGASMAGREQHKSSYLLTQLYETLITQHLHKKDKHARSPLTRSEGCSGEFLETVRIGGRIC